MTRQGVEGFDIELDELPVVDGIVSVPKRPPRTGGGSSIAELITADGAHAVEVDVEPTGLVNYPISIKPNHRTRDLVLSNLVSSGMPSIRRLVRSRARRRGQTVLAVMPSRWPRTIPLALHGLAPLLRALDPSSTFRLSDKGHYGRWVLTHASGLENLHGLLTDPRARLLFDEFQRHHKSGKDPAGSYRRFLTAAAMKQAFTTARRGGEIQKRISGALPDDDWLEGWLTGWVASGLLRVGIWARCKECLKGGFVSLGSFGTTVVCPRCGSTSPTPGVPELGYQLAEVVHQFFANDCDVSALAVAALSRRASSGFVFDLDHEILEEKGDRREFDFVAVVDGQLWIGESKKQGQLEPTDFEKLKRIARRVRPDFIAIASGSTCEGGCTDKCVRDYTSVRQTSDTCLPAGTTADPGPRDRLRELRTDLSGMGCEVIVLCAGDLRGRLAAGPRRTHVPGPPQPRRPNYRSPKRSRVGPA